ncbi:MAG: aminotransferase class I/II-fold pyridoxal phosphate-dependent enzyme [candidate division Zixibacteria bacterium]|nr:aminotransferase class I/II-fold pyridoxal phosphate-dependent enzyme [candidate division Zixibacteria bacterium]
MSDDKTNMNEHYETLVVHGDHKLDEATGGIAPPIHPSSTFAFKNADQGAEFFKDPTAGFIYTRIGNPTTHLLCDKIAALEGYSHALTFSSGLASIYAVFIAYAGAGDSIVISDTIYGGTNGMIRNTMSTSGIDFRWVDCTDLSEVEAAIDKTTKLIFIETPANPTLKIIDIEAISKIAKKHNILSVVDNTFQTPYLQKPREFGTDIVMHSATKYLGGHGDLVAGLITFDEQYFDKLFHVLVDTGGILSPFNAWILLRGIKTLHVRMDRHCENARKVAEFLEGHPAIDRVWYPGLKSHPQYELGQKQMTGDGGMISFDLKGGKNAGRTVMDSVHVCTLAVSLGDVDTLIQHPASMTHCSYSEKDLLETGITPGLVRLSVGLEHVDDIIDDLKQALDKV